MSSKKIEAQKDIEPKVQEKPRLFLGVRGESSSYIEIKKPGTHYYQGLSEVIPEVEALVRPAIVINRNNHNVELTYNGEAIIVPPRGRAKVADLEKLGRLSVGVTVIPC